MDGVSAAFSNTSQLADVLINGDPPATSIHPLPFPLLFPFSLDLLLVFRPVILSPHLSLRSFKGRCVFHSTVARGRTTFSSVLQLACQCIYNTPRKEPSSVRSFCAAHY